MLAADQVIHHAPYKWAHCQYDQQQTGQCHPRECVRPVFWSRISPSDESTIRLVRLATA